MSAKMNLKQPYGVVYGHAEIRYTQGGKNYDSQYNEIGAPKEQPAPKKVEVPAAGNPMLANARAFLLQILKENPLSKSAVYKEAENNNQVWNDVRDAAIELGVQKFTKKNLEMWELPEAFK